MADRLGFACGSEADGQACLSVAGKEAPGSALFIHAADGCVYAYIFHRGRGFETHSELRTAKETEHLYEKGIDSGHLSALAQEYGNGIVNLSVGNIRLEETVTDLLEIIAGVEAHDDGFRFRFPFTLAPGYHTQATVCQQEPGTGEIGLPVDEVGDVMLPQHLATVPNRKIQICKLINFV